MHVGVARLTLAILWFRWFRATGNRSDDVVHRRLPGLVWGRTDLPAAADHPIRVLRVQGARNRSFATARACASKYKAARGDPSRMGSKLPGVRREQGMAAAQPRGYQGGTPYGGAIDTRNGPGMGRCVAGTPGRPGGARLHGDPPQSATSHRPHLPGHMAGVCLTRPLAK